MAAIYSSCREGVTVVTRSVVYLGVLVGNILSGILGDTLGRRHAVLVCDVAPSQHVPVIRRLNSRLQVSSRQHDGIAMEVS